MMIHLMMMVKHGMIDSKINIFSSLYISMLIFVYKIFVLE